MSDETKTPTMKEIADAMRDGTFKGIPPISDAPARPLTSLGISDDETFNAIARTLNALRAKLAATEADLEFLRTLASQVIVIGTLARGEELAKPTEHAVIDTVTRIRRERDDAERQLAATEAKLVDRDRELERAHVQLAGCGVAALGWSGAEVKPGDYGWTASYGDVVKLRSRLAATEELLRRARGGLEALQRFCAGENTSLAIHVHTVATRCLAAPATPAPAGREPTKFLVLFKRETDPWDVTTWATRAEAQEFFDRAGEQWNELYLVQILAGPRDVVGDLPPAPAGMPRQFEAWEWGPKQRGSEPECDACLREGKTCVAGNGLEGNHCVYVRSTGFFACAFCGHPPNGAPTVTPGPVLTQEELDAASARAAERRRKMRWDQPTVTPGAAPPLFCAWCPWKGARSELVEKMDAFICPGCDSVVVEKTLAAPPVPGTPPDEQCSTCGHPQCTFGSAGHPPGFDEAIRAGERELAEQLKGPAVAAQRTEPAPPPTCATCATCAGSRMVGAGVAADWKTPMRKPCPDCRPTPGDK